MIAGDLNGFGVNIATDGGSLANFAPHRLIEATTELDGFDATLRALRLMGCDFRAVPPAVLRLIYNSGVAFARTCRSSEEERLRWRNSVIWPVVPDGPAVEARIVWRKIIDSPTDHPAKKE